MTFVNVADLKNPETGLTWRQENLQRKHSIPIDTLVELLPYGEGDDDYNEHTGLRLYVAAHDRDCDGTPLYSVSLCHRLERERRDRLIEGCVVEAGGMRLRGSALMYSHVISGMSEHDLKVIAPPRDLSKFK